MMASCRGASPRRVTGSLMWWIAAATGDHGRLGVRAAADPLLTVCWPVGGPRRLGSSASPLGFALPELLHEVLWTAGELAKQEARASTIDVSRSPDQG